MTVGNPIGIPQLRLGLLMSTQVLEVLRVIRGVQGNQGIPGPSLVIKGILPAGAWVEPDPKETGDIWIAGGNYYWVPWSVVHQS